MYELAGFGDLVVPDRTPPSVYIGGASKALSVVNSVHGLLETATEGYQRGYPDEKIAYDMAVDAAILFSNAVITTITILGYSAMADTVAGGGLGKLAVIDGRAFGNDLVIWVCVILTVLIVQLIQEIGSKIVLKIDKRKR